MFWKKLIVALLVLLSFVVNTAQESKLSDSLWVTEEQGKTQSQ